MKFWIRFCVTLSTLSLTACTGAFFYPMKPLVRSPADLGLSYRDIELTSRDGVALHAWLLTHEEPKGRILFLHGNAENISTHIGSVYWLPKEGYEVLLLDYRGFGRSQGAPSVPAVFADLDAAWQWPNKHHQQQSAAQPCSAPVVLGQSLGGSLATWYFANLPEDTTPPSAIVLDAIFASYPRIASDALRRNPVTWLISPLAYLVLPSKYDPERHIGNLNVPLLQFHSAEDIVIPLHHGESAFSAAQQPKQWVQATGRHIATFNHPEHRQQLLDFLTESLTPCTPGH